MTEAYMMKTPNGSLAPVDSESADKLRKLKVGQGVRVTFTRQRNIKFHRKFFSLLNLAYDAWNPPPLMWRGQQVKTSREHFRKQLLILAGHFHMIQKIDRPEEFELVAKSISFANMDEEEFEDVYSSVIDVLLNMVFIGQTRGDIDNLVNNILAYD